MPDPTNRTDGAADNTNAELLQVTVPEELEKAAGVAPKEMLADLDKRTDEVNNFIVLI